jgi:hypothetical protein
MRHLLEGSNIRKLYTELILSPASHSGKYYDKVPVLFKLSGVEAKRNGIRGMIYLDPDTDKVVAITKGGKSVFNSAHIVASMEKMVRAGYCFTPETKISLLDGSEIEIQELVGKAEFYVYSSLPDGSIVPGRAHSCCKTRENVPVLKITLDNGETIRCTHDHPWMLRDGLYCESQSLNIGQSLMPNNRQVSSDGYEQVFDNKTLSWKFTHQIVAHDCLTNEISSCWKTIKENSKSDKRLVIHHKNFNKRNNDPSNLVWMGEHDHWVYHSTLGAIGRQWEINRDYMLSIVQKNYDKLAAYARTDSHRQHMRLAGPERLLKFNKENASRLISAQNCSTDGRLKQGIGRITKQLSILKIQGLPITEDNWKITLKTGSISWNNIRKYIPEFETVCNHKVVSIEPDGFSDVYDFTVDTHHNFALSAGVFVHNCFDGEFEGKDWSQTISITGTGRGAAVPKAHPDALDLQFYPFDMITTDEMKAGKSLMGQKDRRLRMLKLIRQYRPKYVHPVERIKVKTAEDVFIAFNKFLKKGLEGGMVKAAGAGYTLGAATQWWKIKAKYTKDWTIVAATEGTGKYVGMLGSVTVATDGTPEKPGNWNINVGTGFDDKSRRELWELHQKGELIGKIAEVGFEDRMPNGSPRAPLTYIRLRLDRDTPNLPTDPNEL